LGKRIVSVTQFNGIETRVAASKLPEGKTPLERNADRTHRGSWRPRLGLAPAWQPGGSIEYALYSAGWGKTATGVEVLIMKNQSAQDPPAIYHEESAALSADWEGPEGPAGFISAPTVSVQTAAADVQLDMTHRSRYGVAFNIWRDGALVSGEYTSATYGETAPGSGTYLYEIASVTQRRVSGEKAAERVTV
jgi:hypothetical protein